MKKVFATDNAPAAIGPYSQAVQGGDYVYVSGQLPIDPATGQFAGDDIASQTRQSLTNIKSILESEGLSMDNVVKTTVLLDSIADFGAMNEVYAHVRPEPHLRWQRFRRQLLWKSRQLLTAENKQTSLPR